MTRTRRIYNHIKYKYRNGIYAGDYPWPFYHPWRQITNEPLRYRVIDHANDYKLKRLALRLQAKKIKKKCWWDF